MKQVGRLLLGLFGAFLLACGPAPVPTPVTSTATPPLPTPTPSSAATVTPTSSPAPRPTPRPTQRPSPTAQPSPIPPPTPVPWGGRVVFSSRRPEANGQGVTFHLYTIDLANGTVTQLTFGDGNDACPSWSPDGKRIAFVSNRSGQGNYDLFVINSDGSGLAQLTETPEDETDPVWSPDGAQIAYVMTTPAEWPTQESRLHLLSVADRTSVQLTHGPGDDSSPDWSPDGRFLAFDWTGAEGDRATYLWTVETGSFTRLEFPGASRAVTYDIPRWLPRDGDLLLSVVRSEYGGDVVSSEIVVFQVEERANEITLRQTSAAIETNFAHYTWGPGGEWLIGSVWVWTAGPQTYNLLRVRVSLTKPSRACWQCADLLDAEFLTTGDYRDDFPDWTP